MSDPATEPSPHETPSTFAIATAFFLIYISWGTTYFATSYAMKEAQMPPALFGGVRLILAGVILLTYQVCRGQSVRISRSAALRLLPVSAILFLMGNWLINLGQREVESGISAILIATTPLWIGLFGMFWPHGERLTWRGWLGLAIGFAGIVVTVWPKLKDGVDIIADAATMFVLASAAAWAIGSILSRHIALPMPHLTSAGYQMIMGGGLQTALGTLLGEWPDLFAKITGPSIAAFLYLLIVGSLIGFVAFNWLLGHVPAAKVGTYAYVNPTIAIFIGWVTGETPVNALLFAGIAIILVGVFLVRSDHLPSKELELEPD